MGAYKYLYILGKRQLGSEPQNNNTFQKFCVSLIISVIDRSGNQHTAVYAKLVAIQPPVEEFRYHISDSITKFPDVSEWILLSTVYASPSVFGTTIELELTQQLFSKLF